jgi:hypothetical protein
VRFHIIYFAGFSDPTSQKQFPTFVLVKVSVKALPQLARRRHLLYHRACAVTQYISYHNAGKIASVIS